MRVVYLVALKSDAKKDEKNILNTLTSYNLSTTQQVKIILFK